MTNLGIMERARKLLGAAGRVVGEPAVKNRRATDKPNAERSGGAAQSTPQPIWMETEARVTDCRHELVRTSALTLRITNDFNQTDRFLHLLRPRTNILRQLRIACSQGARRGLFCLLQCPEPATEHSHAITVSEKRSAVGYRHPQLCASFDASPRHCFWLERALKRLAISVTVSRVSSKYSIEAARRTSWTHFGTPPSLVLLPCRAKAQARRTPWAQR